MGLARAGHGYVVLDEIDNVELELPFSVYIESTTTGYA
jgi:hypothetical protein